MGYMSQVEQYLYNLNYDVMFNTKTGIYSFEYKGTHCNWTTFIDFNVNINLVTVYCKRISNIDKNFYNTLMYYFNLSNMRLNLGAFYLIMEKGEIYFRLAQNLYPNDTSPVEILNEILSISLQIMDNYNAGVNAILQGNDIKNAFEQVENSENSYDLFSF